MHSVLSATFIIKTRPNSIGFRFPEEIRTLLGLDTDVPVALVVRRITGELIFWGVSKLTSHCELTDAGIFRNLECGEEILVTASRPPSSIINSQTYQT